MVAGDSATLLFMVGKYGKPGWREDIEVMKERSSPIFEQAAEMIASSRLEVCGLKAHRLKFEKATSTRVKESAERNGRDFARWISGGRFYPRDVASQITLPHQQGSTV